MIARKILIAVCSIALAGFAFSEGLVLSETDAPVLASYRAGTNALLRNAVRAFRAAEYADAVEAAHKVLDYEPECLEAAWILALSHEARGELGGMLDAFAKVGIREASESQFAREVVYRGSKGYLLSTSDKSLLVDWTEADGVKVGDSFVIYAEGEALQHPITFQILYVERRLVAEIEIKSVRSSHSVAEVVKSYGQALPGMRVVPKVDYDKEIGSIVTVASK